VSYHKYDAAGKTQVYNARLEEGTWKIQQASDWDYRWEFSGGGAIPFEVGVSPVTPAEDGFLLQPFSNAKCDSGTWKLDEATLKPVGMAQVPSRIPDELGRLESDFPGMQTRRSEDLGASPEKDTRYLLQWQTLGANRDRPREGVLPRLRCCGWSRLGRRARIEPRQTGRQGRHLWWCPVSDWLWESRLFGRPAFPGCNLSERWARLPFLSEA